MMIDLSYKKSFDQCSDHHLTVAIVYFKDNIKVTHVIYASAIVMYSPVYCK